MSSNSWSFPKLAACIALLLLFLVFNVAAMAGPVVADHNIDIDDRTSSIVVTDNGGPVTLLPDSNDEFVHFTVIVATVFGTIQSVSVDLVEPGTLAFSDRLLLSATPGSSVIDAKFASDNPTAVPPGAVVLSPVVETGDFQGLLLVTGNGRNLASFSVASPVPEPSTLELVFTAGALAGLGLWYRRRWPMSPAGTARRLPNSRSRFRSIGS
jgi:hypothetical protein